MNDSTTVPITTQGDVDALLVRLKELREQIAAAREALSPLEANLALAYDEFQAVVGQLRRKTLHLQAEIATLRARIEGVDRGQEEQNADNGKGAMNRDNQPDNTSSTIDPEAVEKDYLLEYIFRVLDPMVSEVDAELVATLQGLCNNPLVRLGDMLEKLPWGPVWMMRSKQEALIDQYQRLLSWERALAIQLNGLQRAVEQLEKDSRYGLWQQRQKGSEAWQNFLQGAAEQQREFNDKLTADLEELRQECTRRVSGNEQRIA